jgi:hypothetical protein
MDTVLDGVALGEGAGPNITPIHKLSISTTDPLTGEGEGVGVGLTGAQQVDVLVVVLLPEVCISKEKKYVVGLEVPTRQQMSLGYEPEVV